MITIAIVLKVSPFGYTEDASLELFLSQGNSFEDVLNTVVSEIGSRGYVLDSEVKVISDSDKDVFIQKTEKKVSEIMKINNELREKELKNDN